MPSARFVRFCISFAAIGSLTGCGDMASPEILSAADGNATIRTIRRQYDAGEFEKALNGANSLLHQDATSESERTLATRFAAACHHAVGDEHFRAANMAKCIAAYDAELELVPEAKPRHWQRGIALYYADRYQDGVDQFELHQTVNTQDVENAVWHMLCARRAPNGSVEKAREDIIPIERDSRIPMAEVHEMFAGQLEPSDVLETAELAGTMQAQFYADLYVGLYHEMNGNPDESKKSIAAAADNPSAQSHFMGDVARVHRTLRAKVE